MNTTTRKIALDSDRMRQIVASATEVGKRVHELPVRGRYGRMLVAAADSGDPDVQHWVAAIVALSEGRRVRVPGGSWPTDERQADHLADLACLREAAERLRELDDAAFRTWARAHGLDPSRIRRVVLQHGELVRELGLSGQPRRSPEQLREPILICVLAGLDALHERLDADRCLGEDGIVRRLVPESVTIASRSTFVVGEPFDRRHGGGIDHRLRRAISLEGPEVARHWPHLVETVETELRYVGTAQRVMARVQLWLGDFELGSEYRPATPSAAATRALAWALARHETGHPAEAALGRLMVGLEIACGAALVPSEDEIVDAYVAGIGEAVSLEEIEPLSLSLHHLVPMARLREVRRAAPQVLPLGDHELRVDYSHGLPTVALPPSAIADGTWRRLRELERIGEGPRVAFTCAGRHEFVDTPLGARNRLRELLNEAQLRDAAARSGWCVPTAATPPHEVRDLEEVTIRDALTGAPVAGVVGAAWTPYTGAPQLFSTFDREAAQEARSALIARLERVRGSRTAA